MLCNKQLVECKICLYYYIIHSSSTSIYTFFEHNVLFVVLFVFALYLLLHFFVQFIIKFINPIYFNKEKSFINCVICFHWQIDSDSVCIVISTVRIKNNIMKSYGTIASTRQHLFVVQFELVVIYFGVYLEFELFRIYRWTDMKWGNI